MSYAIANSGNVVYLLGINTQEATMDASSEGRITQARLRELLDYDPETGVFTEREARSGSRAKAGGRAGTKSRDGWTIRLDGRSYPMHSLAWLYVHGEWPAKQLIKLDGDPLNTAIANLMLPVSGGRGDLTQSRLKELLDYNPESGVFLWKIRPSKNVSPGSVAGRNELTNRNIYITVDGVSYTAQRLAWLYVYGEFPKKFLKFFDGDTHNLRIANLYESLGKYASRSEQEKYYRSINPDKFRAVDLKKSFGITMAQYQEMLTIQGGVCAICRRPETAMRNGVVKWLAVDHCHAGNFVRGLVCAGCNMGLGYFGDDPARLRAAADYLEAAAKMADDPDTIRMIPRPPRSKKEAA